MVLSFLLVVFGPCLFAGLPAGLWFGVAGCLPLALVSVGSLQWVC